MENLPICDILMNDAQMFKFLGEQEVAGAAAAIDGVLALFDNRRTLDYSKNGAIDELIKDLVGSDCWAVVVNDKEVLFNSYTNDILNTTHYESFSYKNWIQESMIQSYIIDNVHSSILCNFHRSNVDNHLDIYMFGSDSWKVRVSFKASNKTFSVQGFLSEEAKNNKHIALS